MILRSDLKHRRKEKVPLTPERTCLTLRAQPSQSILILRDTVWVCFFFFFFVLLSKSDKYSKVPCTPIFLLLLSFLHNDMLACSYNSRNKLLWPLFIYIYKDIESDTTEPTTLVCSSIRTKLWLDLNKKIDWLKCLKI